MLCETNLPVSWHTRARGFAALMGLYESNYLRLMRLLEAVHVPLPAQLHSRAEGDCELTLAVVERTAYTTALVLSYLLPHPLSAKPERFPNLRIRIYHDARLAEAEAGERELHHRWQRNLMLNKWLEYCADRGHRFFPAAPLTAP